MVFVFVWLTKQIPFEELVWSGGRALGGVSDFEEAAHPKGLGLVTAVGIKVTRPPGEGRRESANWIASSPPLEIPGRLLSALTLCVFVL